MDFRLIRKTAALALALCFSAITGMVHAAQFTVTDGYAGVPGNGNSLTSGYRFSDLGIGRVVVTDGLSGSTFSDGQCAGQGNVLCLDIYIYDTANALIASYQDVTSDWQKKTSNVTDGFSIEGLTPGLSINSTVSTALFLVVPMRSITPSGTSGSYDVSGSADPFDAADANTVLTYLATVAPTITGPTKTTATSSTDTKKVVDGTSSVFTFTANEPVTWSISGGADSALFTIDQTGALSFITAPTYDPEGTNQYVVEVMATDADGIPVTMTLTVTVVPADAIAPVITGPTTDTGAAATDAKSIPEGTTDVFTFTADEDVTWTLSGGADVALFTIDATGKLAFREAPTYDPNGTNEYVVEIQAEDGAGNTTTMTVTVTVTDATDPVITGPTTDTGAAATDAKSIPEGTTDVFTFTADEDVTWTLSGGADVALFTIDATGKLAFREAPTYDPNGTNEYVVEIQAEDGAGNTTTMTVTVTVTDATDPVITGPTTDTGAAATDAKSIPEGTTDVFTFTADEDVTWTLSGGADVALFTIDATGKLAFREAPTYDPNGTNEYVVEIQAEDGAGNTTTMTVTVTVTDATDPVITGPTTDTGAAATDAKSIPEGTTDVFTFTADEDVAWTLSGGAGVALFTIDATGKLAFREAPTYDPNGTNEYVVEIQAEDGAGNTTTMTVTVTVTDATDPVITGPTTSTDTDDHDTRTVPEGTTDVYAFSASESVQWSIAGGADGGLFTLGADGSLAFLLAPVFDPDGTNSYEVVIEAEDGAGNTATLTVTVLVTDTAEGALDRARDDVERIIADVETAKLRSQQTAIRTLTGSARARLAGGGCGGMSDDATAAATQDDESCKDLRDRQLDVQAQDGTVTISGSTKSVLYRGDARRITQLDLQAAQQGGIASLALNGRLAYEVQPSDHALYGLFAGLTLNRSDATRALSGDVTSTGLTFGAYAVHEFARNLFSEAYAAIGAGRNEVQLGDGHLSVDGTYDSTDLHLGWVVSGLIERGDWEYWPEVALQWSRSRTSSIAVTGAIPGSLTSAEWDGLTTTLGTASVATEVIYNVGTEADPWAVRLKPGLLCEDVRAIIRTAQCGAMLTLGLDHESTDGNRRLSAEASVEDAGASARKSASLRYELRF